MKYRMEAVDGFCVCQDKYVSTLNGCKDLCGDGFLMDSVSQAKFCDDGNT